MCNLGVFNYDDHCTVVVVIHVRLIFIVKRIRFVKFGKDVFLRFRLTLASAQEGEWRSYIPVNQNAWFLPWDSCGRLWDSCASGRDSWVLCAGFIYPQFCQWDFTAPELNIYYY